MPPGIPGNVIALGNLSISQSRINNGFQGHMRIDDNLHGGNEKLFDSLSRNTTQGGVANPRLNLAYISPNATWYRKINYLHMSSARLLNEASVSYIRADGDQPALPELFQHCPMRFHEAWGTAMMY
jgi:hypothetical protein